MKRILLLLLLLSYAPFSFAWTENWDSIRETASRINSISADFQQEKHLPMLKKPLVSKGVLVYQKPDSLRWEYQTPVVSILLAYQGKTSRYLLQNNVYVKDAGAHVQAMQVVLDEITLWLNGRFNEGGNFKANLEKEQTVVLRPVNDQMSKMISRIEITLSKQPGVISSVTIFESQNSYTRLVFSHITLNSTIDAAIFSKP